MSDIFKDLYRCYNNTNNTIDWYRSMRELIEFRKMFGVDEKDITKLVYIYLEEFKENKNTIVGKCWKLNET